MSNIKIALVTLIIVFLVSGCSVTRKAGYNNVSERGKTGKDITEGDVFEKNISGRDFIISRIKIKFRTKSNSRTVSGFMKHKKNGDILLSLRSVAGIEVARILINQDSIKVYDKLNYILYIQDVSYMERKYGIEKEVLPLLWGDLPEHFAKKMKNVKPSAGTYEEIIDKGINYRLGFDKEFNKINEVIIKSRSNGELLVKHHKYTEENGLVYPIFSTAKDSSDKIDMEIKYSGVKAEKIRSMRFNTMNVLETKVLR